ncbi:MAG: RNA methyltransferase [Clostridia bacterium]|nr:RNA methyltransferase [Clostridia bacterium]
MDTIISKSNEKVKYIKSLNDKKFRKKYKAFYLEGIKVVTEILRSKKAIDVMFIAYSEDLLIHSNGGEELLSKLKEESKIECVKFSESIFCYVTDTVTPQGILAVVKIPEYDIFQEIDRETSNILILDKVQDLGNLGTIIRSADSFHVKLVICNNGTADVYSPKVVRSTMGSIFRVKVIYTSEIQEIIQYLKNKKYSVIGTSLRTDKYLSDLNYLNKHAYILGNEANGVEKSLLDLCDELVKIEMENTAESLNVSVATSIILYEQYKNKK